MAQRLSQSEGITVMNRLTRVGLASATISLLIASTANAQQIGTATEARNQVSSELNAQVRTISRGSGVSSRETVRTGPASTGAFRFRDGSNLNVGENSTVVLDRFVFDPNAGGNVVSVTKGAMRFVGGRLGRRTTVLTTNAVLGIRN